MKDDVCLLGEASDVSKFGGKAANLAVMLQAGLPVPGGLAVSLNAFDEDEKLKPEAKLQIEKLLSTNKLYAVRSSALAEDAEGASWAGQFETFLDTKPGDVIDKVEECHNSAKARARAYATDKSLQTFDIAVVVQEMLKPDHAGVLFTKDPVTGADKLVTEYVEGIGEELVSGKADPKQIIWSSGEAVEAPFDTSILAKLAAKAERVFGSPQDIEWVSGKGKMWLVQARPITATQTGSKGFYLGEPEELFYWGPSRAEPMYMSDFTMAAENFFKSAAKDPKLPNPPKTLVLFHQGKVVWLINTKEFTEFTSGMFSAYEKRGKLHEDITNWQQAVDKLDTNRGDALQLVEAWKFTLFAEFSLYGAESALTKRLQRFDNKTRQEIWGAFTVPDNSTFLSRIDEELIQSKDPQATARKYPWVEDGYNGISNNASKYFTERLKMLLNNTDSSVETRKDRSELAKKLGLAQQDVNALNLVRELAEFMDERKAWMMRTRRYITKPASKVEHGWLFNDGKVTLIGQKETADLWERYIDFKVSNSAVTGIVASNGGRHFINGVVKLVSGPTDIVADDQILIVPSTSPSYVPLMRKARALVTDHGGMMSHAAIVAREFGLPCIVGTKQATKVLKDGDKVVLDLVKGTVNK